MKGIGIRDEFGQVGTYNDLLKAYNMTKEDYVKHPHQIRMYFFKVITYGYHIAK